MSSAVVPSFSSDLMIVHGIVQQMGATGAAKADIAALHRRAQIAEQSCAANPEYSAVVFDYGGRLALAARDFAGAYSAFLEAFKAFESSGSPRKIGCIKLCVVAKMLSNSAIKCAADKFLKSWHSSELIHAISHCCSSVTTLSHNRGAGGDIIIFDFLFACAPAPLTSGAVVRHRHGPARSTCQRCRATRPMRMSVRGEELLLVTLSPLAAPSAIDPELVLSFPAPWHDMLLAYQMDPPS